VLEIDERDESYDAELNRLIEASKIDGCSLGQIDECLWIYVCRGRQEPNAIVDEFTKRVFGQSPGIKQWLITHLNVGKLNPVINLIDGENEKVTQPIVLKNMKEENIVDVITRRVHVILYFDWVKFSELVFQSGAEFRWSTKGEAKKYMNQPLNQRPLIIGGRVPIVTTGKKTIEIGGGTFFRAVYDGARPSAIARQCVEAVNK
jgi:hypothetical protein